MDNRPLVSIITIFFNAERFIEEAVDSIFAQSYDRWELLLVDDGSTDASTRSALRYARQHPERVRYLEHAGHCNRGMSASRNLGIRHARGRYIALLDADDTWLPEKLERQVAILEAQPEAAMVYGPAQFWYSWSGIRGDIQRDSVPELGLEPDTLVKPPALLTLFLREEAVLPVLSGVLLRREAIERVGGFVPTFRGMYEDQVFFAKLCLKESVFAAGECLTRYRQHPDSCCDTAIRSGEYHPDQPHVSGLLFLNWLERHLLDEGYKGTELWRVVSRRLWPYRHLVIYRTIVHSLHLIKETRVLLSKSCKAIEHLKRLACCKPTGSIKADPNPIRVYGRSRAGATVLSWTSARTTAVEVHVGAPDGPLLSRTGPSGSIVTGEWVADGTLFCLQDVSGGLAPISTNTLDSVTVSVNAGAVSAAELLRRGTKAVSTRAGTGSTLL